MGHLPAAAALTVYNHPIKSLDACACACAPCINYLRNISQRTKAVADFTRDESATNSRRRGRLTAGRENEHPALIKGRQLLKQRFGLRRCVDRSLPTNRRA
ncbi:hypothetical protein EVAR_6648_1 [Eumeta japonica]|uniref:Uncharacterized protein n=1 Tax=Eumeta variegata TaxID=151549 RepID=A0A4C1TNB7_EUMVA|nr:hypothetical protein EVAR_6648_1 [Eumeta japonica]